ncbi:MAG: Uma2 family endonuclease [Tepidisphaeraceae bacterium]|jgi:Uma2 family endonuclease
MIRFNDFIAPTEGQIVLDDVSWEFYENLLKEIGDGHLRVTYDNGNLEIVSPQLNRERYGCWISMLIDWMAFERSIEITGTGSATFRIASLKKGLEPDKCFYVKNALIARKMEGEFDAAIHPVPDLVVEIDTTKRHVPRQPVFAALGVKEIWHFDGTSTRVLRLTSQGKYVERLRSQVFPFVSMREFGQYVLRMKDKDQSRVRREFRDWVRNLPA